MAGRKGRPRELVEELAFQEGREQIVPDAKRWDEFWRAVEWALVRNPGGFDPVNDDLWVIVSEASRTGMPRIRVYYSFDEDRIYLKWVEVA